MIHVYHGNGKGKTTAAIGLAVRAAGAGKRVLFAQFMKGNESSEIKALRQIPGIQILSVGKQFGFYNRMSAEDKEAVTERHSEMLLFIKKAVETGGVDVVILDEFTYVNRYGLADAALIEEIVRFAKKVCEKPDKEQAELVITGRTPDEIFLQAADYITEMKMQRHPYEKGIPARLGIEM